MRRREFIALLGVEPGITIVDQIAFAGAAILRLARSTSSLNHLYPPSGLHRAPSRLDCSLYDSSRDQP